MKKFISKLYSIVSTRTSVVIISVILAIVAWFYVLTLANPVVEKTFSVEIQYENFSAPAEKKLTLMTDLGVTYAEITVSGRENIVSKLSAEDLEIAADFNSVQKTGQSYVDVGTPVCDMLGIKIVDYYPKEISVNYDTKTEIYLPVNVEYSEEMLKEGYEIVSVSAEPDSIPMSDFASELSDLDHISVNLADIVGDNTVDSDKTYSFIGKFITTAGTDVTANFDTEKITVKVDVAKRVPITYEITGDAGSDCYLINSSLSVGSVLIDGSASVLAGISEIDLGEIDMDGTTESITKSFNLSDYIPTQTILAESGTSSVTVTLEIGSYDTRTLVLKTENIRYVGENSEKYNYDIRFHDDILNSDGNINVVIKGKTSEIDDIETSSLGAELKLGDEGTYINQEITFDLPEGITVVGDYSADITVTLIETEEPQETEAPDDMEETDEPGETEPAEETEAPEEEAEETPEATIEVESREETIEDTIDDTMDNE